RMLVGDLDRDENQTQSQAARPGDARPGAPARPVGEAPPSKSACQPADLDLVVFGPAGVQVFRNDLDHSGKRLLTAVDQERGVENLREVLAGVLVDVDHDGDLDLVLSAESGVSIWANIGQLKFTEITVRTALPPAEIAATSLVAVDWDRDLDTDILVAGPNDVP